MIKIDKIDSSASYRFILTPNCSINWRQLLMFYLFTCTLALGLALHIVSHRTHKREVITIDNASVRIEKGLHYPDQCWEFEKSWIRLHDKIINNIKPRRKLELGSHGKYVEVGNFLGNFEKDELVFRLKDCIIRA